MSRRNFEPFEFAHAYGLYLPKRTLILGSIEAGEFAKVQTNLLILSQSPDPITVIMNCDGGSDIDGLAIYGAISSLANHVTIHVRGEASSMGAVILQAGDTRTADPEAEFMLHDGQESSSPVHARDFEGKAEQCRKAREKCYRILAGRSGRETAYFRRKMARDWYLTAEEALKEGLIDGIGRN